MLASSTVQILPPPKSKRKRYSGSSSCLYVATHNAIDGLPSACLDKACQHNGTYGCGQGYYGMRYCRSQLSNVIGGEPEGITVSFSGWSKHVENLPAESRQALETWFQAGKNLFGIEPITTKDTRLTIPYVMTKPPWWTYFSACWFRYAIDCPKYVDDFHEAYQDTNSIWLSLAVAEARFCSPYRADKRIFTSSSYVSDRGRNTEVLRILSLKRMMEDVKNITEIQWIKDFLNCGGFVLNATTNRGIQNIGFDNPAERALVLEGSLRKAPIRRFFIGRHNKSTIQKWMKSTSSKNLVE